MKKKKGGPIISSEERFENAEVFLSVASSTDMLLGFLSYEEVLAYLKLHGAELIDPGADFIGWIIDPRRITNVLLGARLYGLMQIEVPVTCSKCHEARRGSKPSRYVEVHDGFPDGEDSLMRTIKLKPSNEELV